MKRKARLLLAFLTVTAAVSAQNATVQAEPEYKRVIAREFAEFQRLIAEQQFERAMDYIPDELFAVVPRDTLIMAMKQMFDDPDVEIKLDSVKLVSIGDAQLVEGKYLVRFTYSYRMSIRLEADGETVAMLKSIYNNMFGEDNVTYDKRSGSFELAPVRSAIAYSTDGTADATTRWKFLNNEKEQLEALKLFISE
ncbi:MAG: hypothetical protein LBH06_03395 [Rikenellaceae bacterium]|jgi:hypothetical protein|nr:hypothetical protein [Rikenellaceae bacterium]